MSEKLSKFAQELSPEKRKLLELMLQEKRQRKASAKGEKHQEAIPRRDPTVVPPLSFAQQRLWFIQQLQPENAAYNIPSAVRLKGSLDEALFEAALNQAVQRHETLRTTFILQDGQPVQQIASRRTVRLPLVDLERLTHQQRERQTQKMVDRLSRTPLELAQSPPWRAVLYRLASEDHVFQAVLHHIISDTWTTGVFFREMAGHYQALAGGQPSPLPPLPVQYADYALWQRAALRAESRQRQIEYWKRRFEGALPLLPLPADRPRPPLQSFRGGRVFLDLPRSLTERIKDLSASRNATLFMTLMAAYQTLLFRCTGETDILVGTPMANRNRVELENLLGLFVNTLVIRTAGFKHNPPFTELLAQVREATLEGLSNHEVPFERVVDELKVERDTSRNPVFQALFAFQNVPIPRLVAEGLTLKRYEFRETTARLDLELDMQEMPGGFVGWIGYNADLFDRTSVQRIARSFQVLLRSIADDPEKRVGELPLITRQERHQLLTAWNDSDTDTEAEATLTQLFVEQAKRRPDAVGVVGEKRVSGSRFAVRSSEEKTGNPESENSASETYSLQPTAYSLLPTHLSFAELERRSKQLAARLARCGVRPDTPVGLCLGRCPEAVIGIAGILRAGGGYLPLDEKFPLQRLDFILQEAGAPLAVTWRGLAERLPEDVGKVFMDGVDEAEDSAWQPPPVHPQNLAYLLYTSGSTGQPKGVLVPHRPVVHLAAALRRLVEPGRTAPQRAALNAPLVFDPSVQQWVELLWGNCLVVVHDEARLDAREFLSLMERQAVDVVDCTPTQLQAWVDAGLLERPQARGMTFLVGGEALPRDLCQRLAESPQTRVHNLYGTSECAVDATSCRVNLHLPDPLLGYPLPNIRVHLLDERGELVPLGAVGELCIAGEGPGRGYLGRPAWTAQSYRPDPWSPHPGARLYRTGDLARRRPDGRLDFLGRNDFQVKVRGYRIELGEVEAALSSLPQVQEAVVVARDRRLVAYVVGGQEEEGRNRRERGGRTQRGAKKSSPRPLPLLSASSAVDSPSLRNHLKAQLPEYMIPSLFVEMESFPRTPNGKVDRSALPAPDSHRPTLEAGFEAPQSGMEQSIAEIWKKVLGVDEVGLNDNFFDLGGHSMLLAQVHKELQELAPQLTLVDLFKYPTIGSLAGFLSGVSDLSQVERSRQRASARQEASRSGQTGVAIIGAALRVPGANTPDQLWENLVEGVESISFFSRDEVLEAGVSPEAVDHPDYVRAEGVIDSIDEFDPDFFGYSDQEVEMIDPQQRIFLELAWEALERAGYDPEAYPGNIGVFAGQNISSYLFSNLYDFDPFSVMSQFLTRVVLLTGNAPDYLTARVSYHLKLRGPSVGVQTACSTAMVAAHTACQSLLGQECDMALAGGVQLRVPQKMGYRYQEGGFPSPDGHCRSFDARAKGTVHGNGAGLVLLKRLSDARRDGDHILAVIRGSAVTNDAGLKVGFTAPSVEGQARACAEALAVSQVDPNSIGYLEASGTGTELGDPIEIEALTQAFRSSGVEGKGTVPIGSIKSNIGHLDAASGAASMIKAALSLQREKIPPTLHFAKPNPNIDFAGSPFFVNAQLRDWPRTKTPRRASVHSYAVGGTNAHLVLEEAPAAESTPSPRPHQLLLLSARTSSALHQSTLDLADYLEAHPEFDLADVAYTLQVGRRRFPFRRAVLCGSRQEAIEALRNLDAEKVWTGFGDSAAAALPDSQPAEQMEDLAQLWLAGASIDWSAVYAHEKRLRVPLPTYPFERRRIWAQPKISQQEALWRRASSGRRLEIDDWFYAPSWQRSEELKPTGDESSWKEKGSWL
ncbi:MAG: amino acid adenylation domain-containing protein, partial [Acidobacteriota bacterium]